MPQKPTGSSNHPVAAPSPPDAPDAPDAPGYQASPSSVPAFRPAGGLGRDQRMVIIGAGPAGLGAGYRLRELGHENFQLYERHPYVGGLSHSFTDEAGFTWDIGGHVMFSHYTYYDQCFDRLMGDAFTLNDRECWVRMLNRWVPYPFQNNIRYLPREIAFECLAGLIKAQTGRGTVRSAADAANFGEFIDAVFGEGIAKHFMRPYNFKVWAHPPEMMNKTWIGERVAIIDIERALKNVVLEQDDFGWGPNNRFKFPLKGGTGAFYQRFGDVLHDRITLETTVKSIDVDRKVVTFTDGRTDRYDALLSTMPLDVLCRDILTGQVPRAIRDTAARLRHSSGFIVGIGIKRPCPSTKSWMYFPGPECPFYRVTYLSNYSPYMTPDKDTHYSFLCEVSQSEFKPVDPDAVVEDVIRGLENTGLMAPGERADIISRWCYHADYSYPTPTVDRDEILSEVIPWLEEQGIYSRGRFGMWKYEVSNTDHSLMQGVELVNRLLLGEKEHTIGLVYKITDDGRAAAEHERAAVAGSGERKLAPAAVEPKPEPGVPSLGAERVEHAGDIDEAELAEEELGITSRNEAKH